MKRKIPNTKLLNKNCNKENRDEEKQKRAEFKEDEDNITRLEIEEQKVK